MFRARLSMVVLVLLLFATICTTERRCEASEHAECELVLTRTRADGTPGETTVIQGTDQTFKFQTAVNSTPYFVHCVGADDPTKECAMYVGVPLNGPLKAGTYEQTQSYPVRNIDRRRPTLAVYDDGWHDAITGSFEIKKFIYSQGKIASLWLTFIQTLRSGEILAGELRFHIDSTATPSPWVFALYAGEDFRAPLNRAVQLQGMEADDGSIVPSCIWSIVSNPAGDVRPGMPTQATFADTTALNSAVTFSAVGKYTLRLGAQGYYENDTVNVTVYDDAVPWASLTSPALSDVDAVNFFAPTDDSSFTLSHFGGGRIECRIDKKWDRRTVWMSAPANAPFHVGTYLIGADDLTVPRITIFGPYPDLTAQSGTLEIKRVVYGNNGKVEALWAIFSVIVQDGRKFDGEIHVWPDSTLTGVNLAPRVTVGADRRVATGSTIQLTAVAGDDDLPVAGRAPSVKWQVVSAPESVAFTDPESLQTAVTLMAEGDYTFACTASDGELSYTDEVLVQVRDFTKDSSVRMHASWQDYYGDEMDRELSVREGDLSIKEDTGKRLVIRWQRLNGKWWEFTFQAPDGKTLGAGKYVDAVSPIYKTDSTLPAFMITTNDNEPPYTGGVFHIQQLVRNAAGEVDRFSAFFEGNCVRGFDYKVEPNSRGTRGTMCGELRYFAETPTNQPPTLESAAPFLCALDTWFALPEKAVDPDGLPAFGSPRFLWKKVSGPGNVSFYRYGSPTGASCDKPGHYVLSATASDGVLTSVSKNFDLFVIAAKGGFFSGRLTIRGSATGLFDLMLTQSGAFTASILVNGEVVRCTGAFGQDGTWSTYRDLRGGGRMKITLQIQSDGRIGGTIEDGFVTYETVIERINAYAPVQHKMEQMLAVMLRADPLNPDAPGGTGIGLLKVTRNGAVRLSGVLPDGKSYSVGTRLDRERNFSFHRLLYGGRGALSGMIRSSDIGGHSYFEGGVEWQRAVKGPPWTTNGWHTLLDFYTGEVSPRYSDAFVPGMDFSSIPYIYLKASSDNGSVLTWKLRQLHGFKLAVTDPNPNQLKVRTAGGLIISGKWKDTTTGEPRSFLGILSLSTDEVEGFFLGKSDSGKITVDIP